MDRFNSNPSLSNQGFDDQITDPTGTTFGMPDTVPGLSLADFGTGQPQAAPNYTRPYVAPDVNVLSHSEELWRHALRGSRHEREEVEHAMYWAKLCRAEGKVANGSDKIPANLSQAAAAAHLVTALRHLDHTAEGTNRSAIAKEMLWEVASMRTPSLSGLPDIPPAPGETRDRQLEAWDYLFAPANLRVLCDAARSQISGADIEKWRMLQSEGLTSPRFGRLLEQYTGMAPFGWQHQMRGQRPAIPAEVVERLSFIVQAEAAMHFVGRLPVPPTVRQTSVIDILASSTPGQSQLELGPGPEVAARLRQHQAMIRSGVYAAPLADHRPRHAGETAYDVGKRRQRELDQYIRSLDGVQDHRWRAALTARAQAELQPLARQLDEQDRQQREALQQQRDAEAKAEHRALAVQRLARMKAGKQLRLMRDQLELQQRATESAAATEEHARHAANTAEAIRQGLAAASQKAEQHKEEEGQAGSSDVPHPDQNIVDADEMVQNSEGIWVVKGSEDDPEVKRETAQ